MTARSARCRCMSLSARVAAGTAARSAKDAKAAAAGRLHLSTARGHHAATVQTLFATHGVVAVPRVRSIEIVHATRELEAVDRHDVGGRLHVVGPDGSTLEATTVGIGRDNADKGANKAMTQAFKYLLLQVLCISDSRRTTTDGTTSRPMPHPLRIHFRACRGRHGRHEGSHRLRQGRTQGVGRWPQAVRCRPARERGVPDPSRGLVGRTGGQ